MKMISDINKVAIWIKKYNDNNKYYYKFSPKACLNVNDNNISNIAKNLSRLLMDTDVEINGYGLKIYYNKYIFKLSFNNGSSGYKWRIYDAIKY